MDSTKKKRKIIEKKNVLKSKITYFTLVLMRCEAQKKYFWPYNRTNKENKKKFPKN